MCRDGFHTAKGHTKQHACDPPMFVWLQGVVAHNVRVTIMLGFLATSK